MVMVLSLSTVMVLRLLEVVLRAGARTSNGTSPITQSFPVNTPIHGARMPFTGDMIGSNSQLGDFA
jgi:hypothetical protein